MGWGALGQCRVLGRWTFAILAFCWVVPINAGVSSARGEARLNEGALSKKSPGHSFVRELTLEVPMLESALRVDILAGPPDLSPAEKMSGCYAGHRVSGLENGFIWFMAMCLAESAYRPLADVEPMMHVSGCYAGDEVLTMKEGVVWFRSLCLAQSAPQGVSSMPRSGEPSRVAASQSEKLYSLGCFPGDSIAGLDELGSAVFYAMCPA